jgi:hypothetical protein
MVAPLTIENLENGKSKLTNFEDINILDIHKARQDEGKNELDEFYKKIKESKESNRISIVDKNEEIDCNMYNYYHKYKEYIFATEQFKTYVTKIGFPFGCKDTVESYLKNTNNIIYKVNRKDRPAGEKLKTGLTSFFNRSDAAPATNAAPAGGNIKSKFSIGNFFSKSGGRKSRNQRKSIKQRKSRKQRRSRR